MPAHLSTFVPAAWGWSGPQYVDGQLVPGYRGAWQRFMEQRTAWCDDHAIDDQIEDVLRRHPDEPWGLR